MQPVERVFPVHRTGHLHEIHREEARRTVFFDLSYEAVNDQLPPALAQVSLWRAAREIWLSPPEVLEVWEPLWARYLGHWVVIAAVAKLAGWKHRRPVALGFYAIENSDPVTALTGRSGGATKGFVVGLVRLLIKCFVSRIVFGTHGAAVNYQQLVQGTNLDVTTIEALPSAKQPPSTPERRNLRALFIGTLDRRKGVHTLMTAWEAVETQFPSAVLTLAGEGPLGNEVQKWADVKPESRKCLGLVKRELVDELLQSSAVLVAPSERDGRWREQLGRPILEALAEGLTVVTTTETGLATFLERQGHQVVAPSNAEALAGAVRRAYEAPLSRCDVLAALPSVSGRSEADSWLHRG